ncbi:hypothetical protein DAI22_05g180901 [Oryza sativa Japonica Group]|nr:hypothetical protein DAI22_05g180901 [Oryza sativa Japonica Group]
MATAARLLLLLFLTAAASAWEMNIRLPMERLAYGGGEAVVAPLIHALRPLLGSGGQLAARAGVACDSWRLAVEAHNVIRWKTVPASCEGYVGHYMLGGHYRRDSPSSSTRPSPTWTASSSPATARRSGCSTSTRPPSPTSPTSPSTDSELHCTTTHASVNTWWRGAGWRCRRRGGCTGGCSSSASSRCS